MLETLQYESVQTWNCVENQAVYALQSLTLKQRRDIAKVQEYFHIIQMDMAVNIALAYFDHSFNATFGIILRLDFEVHLFHSIREAP